MIYKKYGSTGLTVSAIGFGGMNAVTTDRYSQLSVVGTSAAAKGNGAYTLQAVATSRMTYIDISYEYMQLVFADEETEYLQCKLYVAEGTLSYVRKQFQKRPLAFLLEANRFAHANAEK